VSDVVTCLHTLAALPRAGNFVISRTCGYHDHIDALNPALWGSIVIMESSS